MFLYIDVQVAGNKIDGDTKNKLEKAYRREEDSDSEVEAPKVSGKDAANGAPSNDGAAAPAAPAGENANKTGKEKVKMDLSDYYTGGHVPWRWPETRAWFQYPADSDSYPQYGFRSLPRGCSDYAGIIKNDSDWNALTQFFEVAYDFKKGKAHFAEVSQTTSGNQYQTGAKLFKAYFERVWKRAEKHEWINSTMRELGALPFQIYDDKFRLWPQPKKVCIYFSAVLHY